MPGILLTNVAIFDCAGAAPYPSEALVQENRIKVVAKGRDQTDRAEAVGILDSGGATLMPGLSEAHRASSLYQLRRAQGDRAQFRLHQPLFGRLFQTSARHRLAQRDQRRAPRGTAPQGCLARDHGNGGVGDD
jgi:cytosine/adenosine deaminase-related metal-dependent hydrolase